MLQHHYRVMKHPQAGFSLVELMVALSLGLFLLLGLIQAFIGNRISYRMHEAVSRVQENGRFSMEIIGRQIRMAGFRAQPLASAPLAAIEGRNNVTGGGDSQALPGTDKLVLRYQGAADGSTVDCAGNSINAGAEVVAVLLVNEDRSLRCAVSPSDIDKAVGVPLLNGVSDMQLLFGERQTDHSGTPPAQRYRYLTAGQVSDWSNIVSVRVDLSVDSVEPVDAALPGGLLATPYTSTFTIRDRM